MEENIKQLLLKDLCARLPYNTKVLFSIIEEDEPVELSLSVIYCLGGIPLGQNDIVIKPYLRPLSSMTDEEEKEFGKIFELELKAIEAPEGHTIVSAASSTFEIDFYNKYHFDYRGLIEKGLALEAPKGMYDVKNNNYDTRRLC